MAEWLSLQTLENGGLTVVEAGRELPFGIERVFYIANQAADARRGRHAHRIQHQAAVCLSGQCTLSVYDGSASNEYVLDTPAKALLLKPLSWTEMYGFSPDCILLVFSEGKYEPSEYIRDYQEFLAACQQAGQ